MSMYIFLWKFRNIYSLINLINKVIQAALRRSIEIYLQDEMKYDISITSKYFRNIIGFFKNCHCLI